MEGGLKGSNKQSRWVDNEEDFGQENRDEVDLLEKEEKKSEVVRGIVNENGAEKVVITTALARYKAQLFPTTRIPELWELVKDTVTRSEVETSFVSSGIKIGTQLTVEEAQRVKRMMFT